MTQYHFITNEFGVSDTGIHLLRSRFNYRTIKFSEVDAMKIEMGKELHNWLLVFIIGAILIVIGVYMSLGMVDYMLHHDITPRHARLLLVLFIPFVGAYFVYNSVQTGTLLKINYASNKTYKFPLRKIRKDRKLDEFNMLMRDKLGDRFKENRQPSHT